ncbi:adenine deaminase [Pradoshia sp.]
MDYSSMQRRINVASGKEPADLVVKGGKILNVFTGEINLGDVAIADGYIAGIGQYEGKREVDALGRFITPSFIDGHVHIESSMVSPLEFAKVQVKNGVTAVIADPHEIANVSGTEGIQYMIDHTEGLPFDTYFMLPSCVPATQFEVAGAEMKSEDLSPFYEQPRVLGLAEVMNYQAVLESESSMMEKILDAQQKNKLIDGHAAGLNGKAIDVYMSAGIRTDHECTTEEEAKGRLEKGMYLMIREGTVAKDLKQIIGVVNEQNARRCLFVTDDRHLDDVIIEGSINNSVRLAIEEGVPVMTAYQMASLNTAECFRLKDQGAIAPGYKADFLLVDRLEDVSIHSVYKNGTCIMSEGTVQGFPEENPYDLAENLANTVSLGKITSEDLKITVKGEEANIIGIIPNSLITNRIVEKTNRTEEGIFISDSNLDHLKIALIERHNATGKIGLGIVKGLGLESGALATTVAHDSHNLIVAGTNDEDMLLAIHELEKSQGGLVIVSGGKVLAKLALPIAGLMSTESADTVYERLREMNKVLADLGVSQDFNPFLTLSFLALPVIPALKITNDGLFDVVEFKHISIDA